MAEETCKKCGCTHNNPCYHPKHGFCWWADSAHTICSHCADEEIKTSKLTQHRVNDIPDWEPYFGIYVGKDLDTHGKRLLFKDLVPGELVLADYSTESKTMYHVCKIVGFCECLDGKIAELDDGFVTPSLGLPNCSEEQINGNDKIHWLYEIPKTFNEIE